MFKLNKVLQQDTMLVGSLPLCELLLMNDSNYPWFILVPRIQGTTELLELSEQQTQTYWRESNAVGNILLQEFKVEKLNIAALGNVVSQLHIHHVGRYKTDIAWPKPVWGAKPAKLYTDVVVNEVIGKMKRAVSNDNNIGFIKH